jgi:outer membrane protein assembly factor BamB
MKIACLPSGGVSLALGLLWLTTATTLAAAEPWPQFRGPRGDGTAGSAPLPLQWSETNHVKWKTPIPGRSWSSPVVWGNQVWLTTATEDGLQLSVLCLDLKTGRVLQNLKLFEVAKQTDIRKYNTYASPTPVIEEGRLYVTFGSPATGCIDTRTGQLLWSRRDLECNHFRGPGSSPILHGNLLLMNFDGSDHQYLVALDKLTGKTVWRRDRSIDYKDLEPNGKPRADGDFRKAFGTPHVATLGGRPTLISQGALAAYGYDPGTGEELWRVEERTSHSAGCRPLARDGVVYLTTGFSKGQVLAIRPGPGKGEVVDANAMESAAAPGRLAVAWKSKRNVPRKPSLILHGDLLFGIEDDGGMASCYEAASGTEVWRERLGGTYSASPILAGNRIYCFNEEGKTTVIEAGRTFRKLAENTLPEGAKASPAASGKSLLIRTFNHLYCLEE